MMPKKDHVSATKLARWPLYTLLMLLGVFTLAVLSESCRTVPSPDPEVYDSSDCGKVGAHLRELGCEEGEALEDGTTFEAFCERTLKEGHDLNLACLGGIASCAEVSSKCGQ